MYVCIYIYICIYVGYQFWSALGVVIEANNEIGHTFSVYGWVVQHLFDYTPTKNKIKTIHKIWSKIYRNNESVNIVGYRSFEKKWF